MIPGIYDCFKHWCKNGSIWILSDTHFDDDTCKLMNPNWISPEKQIEIINSMVYKNDTFICLGDCGELSYFDKLKSAYKVVLLGNHDDGSKQKYYEHFNEVFDAALIIHPKIILSHEPVNVPFAVNIHGHDHNGVEYYKEGCKHLNLAANVCNYTPVSLGKLIKNGLISDVPNIHRIIIDRATEISRKRGEYASNNKTWET